MPCRTANRPRKSLWASACTLLLCALAFPLRSRAQSEPTHTPKPVTPPLDITIPIAPQAFQAAGKWHLVYELHVANLGKWDCTLTRVEVLAAGKKNEPLASFAEKNLEAIIDHPGQKAAENPKIPPANFAVIYLWLTLDHLEDVPPTLRHRLAMKIGDYPEAITLEGVPVTVNKSPVPIINPPLRGENWLSANAPSNSSLHRRALIPINGRATISQRFAIDWAQLYPEGKTYRGDKSDNKSYRAYGAEIHAAANGTVTEIKDGIPQNIPGPTSRAVPITLETIGGNHVIIQIGEGLFAYYGHMQPGSLRVKVGDKIRQGEVLGLVGNSGNSTEPHLHFQICNANSGLASEGLPFALASYNLQGNGWTFTPADSSAQPAKRELEIPLENDVVTFAP
ncbi:MAG: M23 family metallopeptidase [Candidatus Acidiferrales bacterium]